MACLRTARPHCSPLPLSLGLEPTRCSKRSVTKRRLPAPCRGGRPESDGYWDPLGRQWVLRASGQAVRGGGPRTQHAATLGALTNTAGDSGKRSGKAGSGVSNAAHYLAAAGQMPSDGQKSQRAHTEPLTILQTRGVGPLIRPRDKSRTGPPLTAGHTRSPPLRRPVSSPHFDSQLF